MTTLALATSKPVRFTCQAWQQQDIDYCASLEHSANWSSMGTYKTSTGLWLMERKVPTAGNALIVTTKSGKGAYYDTIPRALNLDEWRIFNLNTKGAEEVLLSDLFMEIDLDFLIELLKARKHRVLLLGHYHCFTMKAPIAEVLIGGSATGKIQWDFVLLDEAHKIKNKDSQWTRQLKKLAHASAQKEIHRHIMTGTGFINNPAEIWSLVNFLYPQEFPSYWRFRRTYCYEEEWSGYRKVIGLKADKVDDFIALRKKLGPRRTMQEVHSDIAEPIETTIEVELNATQKRMYREIVRDLMALDQKGYPIHSPNVVSQLQRLRQISVATPELVDTFYDEKQDRRVQIVKLVEPSSKLDAVMEIIEGLEWDRENKQQLVVFSNFKDPLELLKARFDKKGITYIHMEEKDSEQKRYEKWHEIFPRKEHQVFLSTIDLGGESINLTSAEYCIFLDRSWSPAKNLQAVGRIYRPGQKRIAEIIYINAKGTIDKKVLDNVSRKTGWFKLLFDSEE